VLAGLWLVSETEMGTSYVGRWEGGEVQSRRTALVRTW
jgi:hypothetical protein